MKTKPRISFEEEGPLNLYILTQYPRAIKVHVLHKLTNTQIDVVND